MSYSTSLGKYIDSTALMALLVLRPRGIMTGLHFHANMKVQTAMCKDNNNSKSRLATYVKFVIYTKRYWQIIFSL